MPLVLEGLRGRKPQTQCYYDQGVGGHEDLGVGIHGVQGLGASGGLRVFSI